MWWVQLLPGQRLKYGIPEIGRKAPDGLYWENTEDTPDIAVPLNPGAVTDGLDEQLEAAVEALLKQLDAAK